MFSLNFIDTYSSGLLRTTICPAKIQHREVFQCPYSRHMEYTIPLEKDTPGETRRAHPHDLLNAITTSEPKDKLFSSWGDSCNRSLKCTVKGCQNKNKNKKTQKPQPSQVRG